MTARTRPPLPGDAGQDDFESCLGCGCLLLLIAGGFTGCTAATRPEAVVGGSLVDGVVSGVLWVLRAAAAVGLCALILGAAVALIVWLWRGLVPFLTRVGRVLLRGGGASPAAGTRPGDPVLAPYTAGPARDDLGRLATGRGGYLAGFPESLVLLPVLGVHLLLVGGALAVRLAGAGALRGADRAILTARRIRMLCPACYAAPGYPGFGCRRCDAPHRSVRPGRYGVLRRMCRCGTRLPTLLWLGARNRIAPLCPVCLTGLDHDPGTARELALPLFGDPGAGKTALARGCGDALERTAARAPAVRVAGDPAPTITQRPGTGPVPGRPIRVSHAGGRWVIHVFDPPGRRLTRTSGMQELGYLAAARTVVLVIDPLTLPALWTHLGAEERSRLSPHRTSGANAEAGYHLLQQEVERHHRMRGAAHGRRRLALALSRADLLRGTAVEPGDDTARWAESCLGLGNLLRSARYHFAEVGVFATAAVPPDDGASADPGASALLSWALRGEASRIAAAVRTHAGSPP